MKNMAYWKNKNASPLGQEKKKYKEATNKQLEPYTNINLDYETRPFLSDTMHAETKKLFTPGLVSHLQTSLDGNKEDIKLLIGNYDLQVKGRRDIKKEK